jgi:amidase
MKNIKSYIHALQKGEMTSEDIVTYCIHQIQSKDIYYNSVAYLNPNAIEEAKRLDALLQDGIVLSPLHGMPILIKDNIDVKGMPNTANAFILKDYFPNDDAPLVKNLKEAGCIILGKTNLSEWAYFMSDQNMPSGYGSLHGQVIHPFDATIDPLGSSTGSAVAVAASLVPMAIGTETNGSIIAPAYQNQIIGLRPTFGQISNQGIIPISPTQDTAGPMANSIEDLTYLYDVLTHQNIASELSSIEKPFRVGILNLNSFPNKKEDQNVLNLLRNVLLDNGHELLDISIDYQPVSNSETLFYEFKSSINDYLNHAQHPAAHSLKDIINFNKLNKERMLKYGQTLLEKSESTSGNLDDPKYVELRKTLLEKASVFDSLMITHQLDALVSTHWLPESPIFGQPSLVYPMSKDFKKPLKSLVFIGRKHQEKALLQLGYLLEQKEKEA